MDDERANEFRRRSKTCDRQEGGPEEAKGRRRRRGSLLRELELNRAIADLCKAIISSRSMYDISQLVLDQTKRFTESSVGYIGYIDPETNYLICPAVSSELSSPPHGGRKETLLNKFLGLGEWVLNYRRSILSNDTAHDPRTYERTFGDLFIGRYLSAPALIDGNLVGQVAVANSLRPYNEEDLAIVEQLAALYAIAIHREISERSYRAIFDAANDGFGIHIPETGFYDDANYKWCEMFGYSLEELPHLRVKDVTADDPRFTQELAQEYVQKARTEGPLLFEWLCKSKSGRCFWVEVNLKKAILGGKERIASVVRDITDRKEAEAKLRESENKYKTLFEASRDAIILLTPDKRKGLLGANQTALRMFGCTSEEEFTSKTVFDFSPAYQPDGTSSREKVGEIDAVVDRQGTDFFEWQHLRADGTEFLTTVLLTRMDIGGKPILQATVRDITEQKNVERALQESEERFRGIFSESPIGIMVYDFSGQLLEANAAALEIFGVAEGQALRSMNLWCCPFLPNNVLQRLRSLLPVRYEACFNHLKASHQGVVATNKRGSLRLEIGITPLTRGRKDFCSGFLFQVQDITEKKRAEEQIRALTRKILDTQEKQRRMISRELHDRVAQDLSTLKMGLETLSGSPPVVSTEIQQPITSLTKVLDSTISGVRDLAYFLHPPGLDQLGLVRALRQYCEDFGEKTGIQVKFFTIGLDERRLSFQTEINLFRLTQEALSNVHKHAQARNVIIRLASSFPVIILRISDDGRGFHLQSRLAEASREKRMGIPGMQERVGLLGGKMKILSAPGKGTKLIVEVPYKEKAGEPEEDSDY